VSRKDAAKLARTLNAAGWRVEKGRHWKAFAPDGKGIIVWGSTPSSRHWQSATLATLKRLGYNPDGTPR